jgi:hypothetical protein
VYWKDDDRGRAAKDSDRGQCLANPGQSIPTGSERHRHEGAEQHQHQETAQKRLAEILRDRSHCRGGQNIPNEKEGSLAINAPISRPGDCGTTLSTMAWQMKTGAITNINRKRALAPSK